MAKVEASYITVAEQVPSRDLDSDYPTEVNKVYNHEDTTYQFKTGVEIPENSLIMIQLPSVCFKDLDFADIYIAENDLVKYAMKKQVLPVEENEFYSFKGFVCKKSLNLGFTFFHLYSEFGVGENRITQYYHSEAERETMANHLCEISFRFSELHHLVQGVKLIFSFKWISLDQVIFENGNIISVQLNNSFIAGIIDCILLESPALVLEHPSKPIKCEVVGTNEVKISNFKNIYEGAKINLYLTVNFSSSSGPSSHGYSVIKGYGSQDHYPDDFLSFHSLHLLLQILWILPLQ